MALREPFPPERIEKLPKPKWKGAWDDKRGSHCDECHGYHVLENSIHLDYIGHAQTTDRLLEADPWWNWEPMAYTEQGTPLFSDGGLWIKLTVCGVTRIGYGDGKSVKEVIGDAIRNAAMRFGVALDLWAKISLHEERNPGDGKASQRRDSERTRGGRDTGRAAPDTRAEDVQPPSPSPAVQDALESLAAVCDDCGYDRRTMASWYEKWATKQGIEATNIYTAKPDNIRLFAAELLAQASGEPNRAGVSPDADVADERATSSGVSETDSDSTAAGVAGVAGADPADEAQSAEGMF
jgi:hypothetical protein